MTIPAKQPVYFEQLTRDVGGECQVSTFVQASPQPKLTRIDSVRGDVLSIDRGIIVHGCNCNGVMGAGIALQIKRKYPMAYEVYMDKFHSSGLILGGVTFAEVEPMKIIVNANTQQTTGSGRQVSYDAIAECFEKVSKIAKIIEETRGVKLDIVFPMIGAGLGGGNWNIIEKIIDESVDPSFNKILYIYE